MDSGLMMQQAITCELFTVSLKYLSTVIVWALLHTGKVLLEGE
jgi:hypothetical protein